MALAGDTVALRLCMDRLWPVRKDRPVAFALPPINSARDAADVMAAVARAVANGDVTPNEAAEFAKVIDTYVKAFNTAALDERVARVEQLSDAELMRIAIADSVDMALANTHQDLILRALSARLAVVFHTQTPDLRYHSYWGAPACRVPVASAAMGTI